MKFRITMVKGPHQGRSSEKELEQLVIGAASPTNGHLQIAHASISAQHLFLYVHQDQVYGRSLYGGVIIENGFRNEGDFPVFSGRVYELSPDVHLKIEWGDITLNANTPGKEKKSFRQWKIRGVLEFIGAVIVAQTVGYNGEWGSEDPLEKAVVVTRVFGVGIFALAYLFQPIRPPKWVTVLAWLFVLLIAGSAFQSAELQKEHDRGLKRGVGLGSGERTVSKFTRDVMEDFRPDGEDLLESTVSPQSGKNDSLCRPAMVSQEFPDFTMEFMSGKPEHAPRREQSDGAFSTGWQFVNVFPSKMNWQFFSKSQVRVIEAPPGASVDPTVIFSWICGAAVKEAQLEQELFGVNGDAHAIATLNPLSPDQVCRVKANFPPTAQPYMIFHSVKYCHSDHSKFYRITTMQPKFCGDTSSIHQRSLESFICI